MYTFIEAAARACRLLLVAGAASTAMLAWAGVEINQAPAGDLDAIKGIGPRTARLIIQARRERPFSDWEDLRARVRGVGEARARQWSRDGLRVNGDAYAPPRRGTAAARTVEWKPFVPTPLIPSGGVARSR